MRNFASLSLLLLSAPASAKKPSDSQPVVQKVPSIEEVVAKEGFVPTPSQSETYRPGVVLAPNAQGGHDEVYADCVGVEPSIKIMSQSSIATSLSAGVSARLAAARGEVVGGVEKRLSFVDPEQRTIPLAQLGATEACVSGVKNAARFTDLSQAILVYDVLVAQIQNTVCTKADASGSVVLLGAAEAAAYSECVQESDAQVPLGFKYVPLSQVFSVSSPRVPSPPPVVPGVPAAARGSVDFGSPVDLGGIDAQLKEQECTRISQEKGAAARSARLDVAARDVKGKASVAWRGLSGDLEKCTQLPLAQRGSCVTATEQWLSQGRAMVVSLPAGTEPIETACGVKNPEFAAETRTVVAEEVGAAEEMLARLTAPDGVTAGSAGIEWVNLGRFSISKTEVTVGQYRKCVDAGACTAPNTGGGCNWGTSGREDHPVNCVDWNQASAFAKWAGGRLPTGVEWTYAATSGGKDWEYPWGDEAATCSRAVMKDGGAGCGQYRTWPVCSKPAGNSMQGVCDLAGNVWEWSDEGEGASYRVVRGGGWFINASSLHASNRRFRDPSYRGIDLGFRLAR